MAVAFQDGQLINLDWKSKAFQLRQIYQGAIFAFNTLQESAGESTVAESALVAAGEAMHESARALNQFLDSGYSASRLATDIYNRLNAVGGAPLSPVERQYLENQRQSLNPSAAHFSLIPKRGRRPFPPPRCRIGTGRARHTRFKDEQSARSRDWHGRDSEVIQRGRCAAT